MHTKVVFDSPVSNSSVEEILRAMPKYKDDLGAMKDTLSAVGKRYEELQ